MLQALNFPIAPLKLSRKGEQIYVWCVLRKKHLILTPEEWVRQHLIHYLHGHKNIPLTKLVTEIRLEINGVVRRCDLVVYDEFLKPKMLVECKAPQIHLNAKVIQQVIQYNNSLQVPIIAITNGLQHEVVKIDYATNQFEKLEDFDMN